MATTTVPPRAEIATEHTWDAYSIFADDDTWTAEFQAVTQGLEAVDRFVGRLGDSATTLADWFDYANDLESRTGKLYVYASLFQEADKTDQAAAARMGRLFALYGRVKATLAFAEPELLALGAEHLHQWIQQEPRLAIYRQYVDDLFSRQAHVRSSEVEELLGQVLEPFNTADYTAQFLIDSEMRFTPAQQEDGTTVEIAQGNIDALLASTDRTLRRTAWEHYADSYLAYKNTLANNLTAAVKQYGFIARARRFNHPLEMALEPNHIPQAVYTNLLDTFKANLPTWHRYWQVRRQALGYDRLHVYDIKAPLSTKPPRIEYSEAIEMMSAGMEPLGAAYGDTMRRGLTEQRWVDVYPSQGKSSGAFSTGVQGTHPFILMSYTDDLDSVSTLAHEIGHSMHSWHTWDVQPPVYANYSLFVAEVASNFNQALVREYLLRTRTDRDFLITVLEEAMSNFHRYFFIMPTLARFEYELHDRNWRGESMTADEMIALLTDLFKEGYGDAVEIDHDRIGITWAQFGHLYAPFYVYQYATGISGAHALAAPILAGESGAAERYIQFLSAGSSGHALDILRAAGVDLTTPQAVEQAFAKLAQYVDKLEELTA